jgi:hypothetical protein
MLCNNGIALANMVDCTAGNANDTPVFINNNSVTSEVMYACCDKFIVELGLLCTLSLRYVIWDNILGKYYK